MPFGFLALLAAFGALANSLRSDNASALIRTLLRCSARPNGGGYHTARPLRGPRPGCSFASLTSRGLGLPDFSRLTSLKGTARRATTPDPLIPHASRLTSHHGQPQGLPLRSSLLRPHSSLLTPHSSGGEAVQWRVPWGEISKLDSRSSSSSSSFLPCAQNRRSGMALPMPGRKPLARQRSR